MADNPQSTNPDIEQQLVKRMDTMLDTVEKSGDAKAIAAGFRTLVEFARSKPPQLHQFAGIELNVTSVADQQGPSDK
jgi:hypothetical protein